MYARLYLVILRYMAAHRMLSKHVFSLKQHLQGNIKFSKASVFQVETYKDKREFPCGILHQVCRTMKRSDRTKALLCGLKDSR
jgi:hypothetical protein